MDCDSVLLNQPPLPSVQRHRRWERSRGEIRAVWADPGCSRTPGLAEMGSDAAAPQVARLLRAPRRIPAGVRLTFLVLRVPRGGRPRVLPTPFPGGGALLCVCAPSPGRPGLSRVASCRDPLSDRVARVPSTLLLCGPSCSSPVHICLWCGLRTCLYLGSWTRPAYSCLSSKVCARLGGAFSVAPREQFLKSVTRKDQLQLFQ